jgi:prepilin-type N-terminal cleavage/methylation domain-containing protein
MNSRRAFSLFEMLVATILAAILMGGVLWMSAALARDQQRLAARSETSIDGIVQLLRFDLANARTMTQSPDGRVLVLIGHGGLDRRTLAATNRLARVTYRIDSERGGTLSRTQEYIDDRVRPQRWSELFATNVARIDAISASGDSEIVSEPAVSASMFASGHRIGDVKIVPQAPPSLTVPTRVRLRIASSSAPVDQEIWIR